MEILAIGTLALGWLALLLARLEAYDLHQAADQLGALGNWSGPIALVLSLLAYQVGWLVNGLANLLAKRLYDDRLRKRFFKEKGEPYDVVLAGVYARASEYARDDLAVDRSVVRMARAGALNFLILGVILLTYPRPIRSWAALPACLAVAFVALYVQRLGRYYQRMFEVYDAPRPQRVSGKQS